jgi:glutathione synthase/RimK-type ligase-like ATP-grasp enzyme
MFSDGGFSHGAIKRAAAHEFRVQTEHGGSVDLIEISDDLIEQGANVLAALPETPVYARVDGIVRDGRLLLMELELIEPNLFLELQPGADTRLAEAVARRLD